MNKEAMMALANALAIRLGDEEAELLYEGFTDTKERLEAMKNLPLQNVEPALWFVAEERRIERKRSRSR